MLTHYVIRHVAENQYYKATGYNDDKRWTPHIKKAKFYRRKNHVSNAITNMIDMKRTINGKLVRREWLEIVEFELQPNGMTWRPQDPVKK